jgi:hypothetical protein
MDLEAFELDDAHIFLGAFPDLALFQFHAWASIVRAVDSPAEATIVPLAAPACAVRAGM